MTNTPAVLNDETPQMQVKGKIKRSRADKSIRTMIKQKNKVRFDLAIQRNTVWTEAQKSMLVHSIIENYPTGTLFIHNTHDDLLWMLDGKQRLSTIYSFVKDGFHLEKGTPAVTVERPIEGGEEGEVEMVEVDIEGKLFSQLDKDIQDEFLGYDLSIVEVKNITADQVEELFQRLNGGTPLTKIELTRAKAGEATMTFVNEVAKTKFFGQLANITVKNRNRFVDNELILQTLSLVMGRETGISTKEIEDFVTKLKVTGIPDALKEDFFKISEYLGEAFGTLDSKVRNKFLRKTHVPMLFMQACDAIADKIEPEAYALWAKSFYSNDKRYKGGADNYAKFVSAGAAKKGAVDGRRAALKRDYDKHIQDGVAMLQELNAKRAQEALEEAERQSAAASGVQAPDPAQYQFDDKGNVINGEGATPSDADNTAGSEQEPASNGEQK